MNELSYGYYKNTEINGLIETKENKNGDVVISGRDLHEFLGSNERYSKWFERMLTYGFIENIDFTSVPKSTVVNNGAERILEDHALTVNMAKHISMVQRNERGEQARNYFIKLEEYWNSEEMIIKRSMEIMNRKLNAAQLLLEEQKPLVDFGKQVAVSENSIDVGTFAKSIYTKDSIENGRNNLFSWLRENKYVTKVDGINEPTQFALKNGWLELKTSTYKRGETVYTSRKTLVTGKGQIYFTNKLIK